MCRSSAKQHISSSLQPAGIAIYFYSPLWPFGVTTAVSLDGSGPSLLDLRDYEAPFHQDGSETAESQIVWYMDGLDNTGHILNVSVGVDQDLAILDSLVCVRFFLCVILSHFEIILSGIPSSSLATLPHQARAFPILTPERFLHSQHRPLLTHQPRPHRLKQVFP